MTLDGRCKLLDFGALAAFGPVETLVGTAPAIPPEAIAGAPLDQRADLYSLGALAYYMLTGRHAYPARRFEELRQVWKDPPAPPSSFDATIPEELDRLVLSLLSAEPLARPATAAEAIVRLGSIAGLPPEEEAELDELAQSHLMKTRFTGRAAELATLERYVEACAKGQGGAVRITGTSGVGRTRLLEEVCLRAKLAGALVIRADAGMVRSAHGTSRALALRLFDAAPELARERARASLGALAALGHEVELRLPKTAAAGPGSPLDEWFAAIGRAKPLVVAVDDVDHADDGSLGLLAALASGAHRLPLLVVVTERAERATPAPVGLETLRSHSAMIELRGLSAEDTLELTRSIFGEAPNVARFADWLHGWTAGSPLHAVEIARRLVARGVIRYVGGTWMLPAERPDEELPTALEDALSMRLERLSSGARRLAECLCLDRERPTLALVTLLAASARGFAAAAANERGEHARARELCAHALAHVTDADRDYPALFLSLDVEAAIADAGLGRTADAFERIDGLLERYAASEHPAILGVLHEARARVALAAGRRAEYLDDAAAAERWYRRTQNPALVARYERLAALGGARPSLPAAMPSVAFELGGLSPDLESPTSEDAATAVKRPRTMR